LDCPEDAAQASRHDLHGFAIDSVSAFWFIIKMQCDERGITGIREAALLLTAQQEGKVTITPDGKVAGDWNPDDQRHDEKFPDHPVSRLRREFGSIKETLRIHDTIKHEKRFDLPAA